jgi:hypothetical protein
MKAADAEQRKALETAALKALSHDRPALFARTASIARTGSSEAAASPAE